MTETCDNNIPTCDSPRNSYTSKTSRDIGKRIDYILYRPGKNCQVRKSLLEILEALKFQKKSSFQASVLEYKLPLSHPIPNHSCSYSDHEAVSSRIRVIIAQNAPQSISNIDPKIDAKGIRALNEAIEVCYFYLKNLRSHKTIYFTFAFGVMMTLFYLIDMVPPYGLKTMFTVLRVIVSGLILFFVFMATLWNSIEANGILSGILAMEIAVLNAHVGTITNVRDS